MGEGASGKPQGRTLLERIILLLPLPYPLGALLFTLWHPAARLVFYLAESANLLQAFDLTFLQPDWAPLWQRVAFQVLGFVSTFYSLLVIRYMRRKVRTGESEVSPLLPGGATAYRDVFAGLLRSLPPILIGGALLGTGLLLSEPPASALEVLLFLPPQMIIFLAYGTWGWIYFLALGGLYRLAKEGLVLRPFYEDRWLGTRPIGTLCLSLAAAYYGLLALLIAEIPLAATPDPVPIFFNLVALSTPAVAGAVAFLLPLRAVHRQLQEAKLQEREAVHQRVAGALKAFLTEGPGDREATLEDIEGLAAADLAERRAEAILTWPVGSKILGRFLLAALTLVAAVLARILIYVLRI